MADQTPAVRTPRRILVLLIALAATLTLAACGSSSSDVGSAQSVLSETFGPGKPIKSGKVALELAFDSKGLKFLSGPVKLRLNGPFQSNGGKSLPSFDLDLGLDIAGGSFSAGAVSTGTAGYVQFAGTNYQLSQKLFSTIANAYKQAIAPAAGKPSSGNALQALGIDPRRWLRSPSKVGTEKVGGTETTHVTAQVDVPKLVADIDTLLAKAEKLAPVGIPLGLSAKTRTAIQQSIKSATVDVWSGVGDGTLRRLLVKVGFNVPAAVRSSVGGLQRGNVSLSLTFSDLNKKQEIATPGNARPMSELLGQVSQLFGGLGGFGGGGSSKGSGAAKPNSKYLSCLTDAGADVTKVQACASLLAK